MSHLAIAPLLLPLFIAILLLFLRTLTWKRPLSLALVAGSQLGQIAFAIMLVAAVADGSHLVYAVGNWPAPFGIVMVVDRLSAAMVLITSLLALPALHYALLRGIWLQGRHFLVLFQLQMFGLYGAFLTGDLFNLFVFFEVLLLASYGLLLHGGGRDRVRGGLHFVVLNLIGSSLFLIAAGLFYGLLGTLNMADMARLAATVAASDRGLLAATGLILLAVFALKGALLPLHAWLTAAYGNTSAPVAALFAIMTKVGAYAILRIQSLVFGSEAGVLAGLYQTWLLPMALLTLVAGVIGALAASGLRQQVASLVVASAGTLITAFAIGNSASIAAGLYYLPHATFAAALLFLLVDSVALRRGEAGDRLISASAVANGRIWGGIFFVAAILMAGLPPLSGFIGKFLLLRSAVEHPAMATIFAVILAGGLLTIIALARSGSLVFYNTRPGECADGGCSASPPIAWGELLPLMMLLVLALFMLIQAPAILAYATATAEQLLQPAHYIHAVLNLERGLP
jgi:multicomponent K+:H+ antiporter subunit D